jgi:hypothetical protein
VPGKLRHITLSVVGVALKYLSTTETSACEAFVTDSNDSSWCTTRDPALSGSIAPAEISIAGSEIWGTAIGLLKRPDRQLP